MPNSLSLSAFPVDHARCSALYVVQTELQAAECTKISILERAKVATSFVEIFNYQSSDLMIIIPFQSSIYLHFRVRHNRE